MWEYAGTRPEPDPSTAANAVPAAPQDQLAVSSADAGTAHAQFTGRHAAAAASNCASFHAAAKPCLKAPAQHILPACQHPAAPAFSAERWAQFAVAAPHTPLHAHAHHDHPASAALSIGSAAFSGSASISAAAKPIPAAAAPPALGPLAGTAHTIHSAGIVTAGSAAELWVTTLHSVAVHRHADSQQRAHGHTPLAHSCSAAQRAHQPQHSTEWTT